MNVFLTLDYELFFGDNTGTVENCMVKPTNALINLSKKYNVGMTYFVDAGHLSQLKIQKEEFPILEQEWNIICAQLKEIIATGNDIQLHIHPHWEDTSFDGKSWKMNINKNYKLSDFSKEKAAEIVRKYATTLEEITGRKTSAFRAGGWCIQPFEHVKEVFTEIGIRYDTSVFPKGKIVGGAYDFDFSTAPTELGRWNFSNNECQPEEKGKFTEIPIAAMRYSPLFYWKLFGWGRLIPSRHKFIGDGNYISQPGKRKEHLTKFSWNHVSLDGFFASKMKFATCKMLNKKRSDLVIIGHPKSQTQYSLNQIEKYLKWVKNKVEFRTFHDLENDLDRK